MAAQRHEISPRVLKTFHELAYEMFTKCCRKTFCLC